LSIRQWAYKTAQCSNFAHEFAQLNVFLQSFSIAPVSRKCCYDERQCLRIISCFLRNEIVLVRLNNFGNLFPQNYICYTIMLSDSYTYSMAFVFIEQTCFIEFELFNMYIWNQVHVCLEYKYPRILSPFANDFSSLPLGLLWKYRHASCGPNHRWGDGLCREPCASLWYVGIILCYMCRANGVCKLRPRQG